ncbi:MAG: SusC/RagA family TonB-linked outer membrane protein [Gemmatimonadaceae bacterium]|nr:SusC/RagA family TonB-linked outer membrane protein [Gemmatimonadaceae bacterium]
MSSGPNPLGGASVSIPELGVGAITSLDGRYSFTFDASKARGQPVNVVARFIGYKPKRMPVTVAAGRIDKDFDLEKDVLNLDQVVVTGVSDATSQKKTAFAVGVVDNSQLKETPSVTPLGGLNGRVAGASLVTTSGQPGSAPAIRLRSATSLTGRQDPLIIVDGTITRLTLADIASEDIERVEVIKGAAASSLYGSDAANGVVQIFTKRGASLAEAQTAVTFRNEYGSSWLPNKVPLNAAHEYQIDAAGNFVRNANGDRLQKADKIADNPYKENYDLLGQVFKPGNFLTNYLSVGQRRGGTNFAVSFQNTKDDGVLNVVRGFARQNFRVNVDQQLNDKLDFSAGAFYGRSNADQPDNNGAIFFGLRFLEPNVDLTANNADGSPFNAVIKQPPLSGNVANPLYQMTNRAITNSRDRFTGTFKTRYRPRTWLTAEGNFNYDVASQSYKDFTPLGFLNSSGARGAGRLEQQVRNDRTYNAGATLTSVKAYKDWFTNTTKVAWVYEDQINSLLGVTATALTVPRVTEFSAAKQDATSPVLPGSNTQTIRNQNFFAVTTFDIKDKFILDGLVRRDESSLFGKDARVQNFYRASTAYRVSEDIKIKGVDEMKLRASYGTAGLRPVFDAQYEQFAIAGGAPVKITLGNPGLLPAYSRETEVGFNVNFLKNFTLEYSYSDKTTTDQIINAPVSSATGYRNQWINAGTLAGQTHELAASAVLLSKADKFWRVNVAADRTRQKITDLSIGAFLVGPDVNNGNTAIFRIAKGQPFGVLYGSRWIKTEAQLLETISSGNLTGTKADYVVNEEGYYVPKADWRTVNERPLKFYQKDGTSVVQIGDVNPDFNLSFATNAQWKSFSLNALLNIVQGGKIYNYTRQWPFNEQRDPVFDQRAKVQVEKKPVTYYQTFYNNFDPNDYFVEDGSFMRLRELALNYALPKSLTKKFGLSDTQSARLGIVGRNLWTKTNYGGYDPDVTGPGGGNPFAYRVDYFTYPAFRTFTAMLEIGF